MFLSSGSVITSAALPHHHGLSAKLNIPTVWHTFTRHILEHTHTHKHAHLYCYKRIGNNLTHACTEISVHDCKKKTKKTHKAPGHQGNVKTQMPANTQTHTHSRAGLCSRRHAVKQRQRQDLKQRHLNVNVHV